MRVVVALHGGVIFLYAMEGVGFAVVLGTAALVIFAAGRGQCDLERGRRRPKSAGFIFVEDLGAGAGAVDLPQHKPK
jgi:hypothetical protein